MKSQKGNGQDFQGCCVLCLLLIYQLDAPGLLCALPWALEGLWAVQFSRQCCPTMPACPGSGLRAHRQLQALRAAPATSLSTGHGRAPSNGHLREMWVFRFFSSLIILCIHCLKDTWIISESLLPSPEWRLAIEYTDFGRVASNDLPLFCFLPENRASHFAI